MPKKLLAHQRLVMQRVPLPDRLFSVKGGLEYDCPEHGTTFLPRNVRNASWCPDCINAEAARKKAKTRYLNGQTVRNLQAKMDRRHAEGYGPKVEVRWTGDGKQIDIVCPVHGARRTDTRSARDNLQWTCKSCQKEHRAIEMREDFKRSFLLDWGRRYNQNLRLLQEPEGSYIPLRVACDAHPGVKLSLLPNGKRFLRNGICGACHAGLRLRDLQATYGNEYTHYQQLPSIKRKKKITSIKNWGTGHYMQSPEGASEHFKRSFQHYRFQSHEIRPWCPKGLVLQGLEDVALLDIVERYRADIISIESGATSERLPPVWWKDSNGKSRRYFPDLVVTTRSGITVYEVKGDYTLNGSAKIIGDNLSKWSCATRICKENKMVFKLAYVQGTRESSKVFLSKRWWEFLELSVVEDPAYSSAIGGNRLMYG